MLDPYDRTLLTESLRPPEGYDVSWALATTFTLDLTALLAVPLSFALLDWDAGEGKLGGDVPALLESLRRYSDRMTVFVQTGGIKVPKAHDRLMTYLEDVVVEAAADRDGALFHPKVWILRFTSPDGPVRYRLLNLTRNLTFDRSWDISLSLEGELLRRKNAIGSNHPLGDFVEALPRLARRRLAGTQTKQVLRMAAEVRRVRWELPPDFESLRFVPLGIKGHRGWPFEGRIDRLLVISPFLGADVFSKLRSRRGEDMLVTRFEDAQQLDPEVASRFREVLVLSEGAHLDARQAEEEEGPSDELTGLHAKAYVADAGWKARVWTGSANATMGAFKGSVEFLVELLGPKSRCGIDAVLEGRRGGLRSLLEEFEPGDPPARDEVQEGLEAGVEGAQFGLGRADLEARVSALEDDAEGYRVDLVAKSPLRNVISDAVSVTCWPSTVREGSAVPFGSGRVVASFELSEEGLTSFFAFKALARKGSKGAERRFALNVPLVGAPEDRRERVLRSILSDPDRLLRFLLFLLSDADERQAVGLPLSGAGGGAGDGAGRSLQLPLFESMLRALHRDPGRIDEVASVIEELRKAPGGDALLPSGFERVWQPIWRARERLR